MSPLVLLLCFQASAKPVALRPELRDGRVVEGHTVSHIVRNSGLADEPLRLTHYVEATGADSMRLSMVTELPAGVSWLHGQLVAQDALTLDSNGAVRSRESIRDDFSPFARLMGLPDMGPSPLPTAEALAVAGCGPLAFRALLPAEAVDVGEDWSVGDVRCTLEDLEGSLARVSCQSNHALDDPWADHRIESARTLAIDVEQRLVTRCEQRATHRRTISTNSAPVDQGWVSHDVYTAATTDAVSLGISYTTKAILALILTLVGALGGLAWAWKRR